MTVPDPSWIGSDGLDYRNQDWDEESNDDTTEA